MSKWGWKADVCLALKGCAGARLGLLDSRGSRTEELSMFTLWCPLKPAALLSPPFEWRSCFPQSSELNGPFWRKCFKQALVSSWFIFISDSLNDDAISKMSESTSEVFSTTSHPLGVTGGCQQGVYQCKVLCVAGLEWCSQLSGWWSLWYCWQLLKSPVKSWHWSLLLLSWNVAEHKPMWICAFSNSFLSSFVCSVSLSSYWFTQTRFLHPTWKYVSYVEHASLSQLHLFSTVKLHSADTLLVTL